MSETSSKHFGSIRDDYAFFLQHSTEAEADLRAYAPHLHGLAMADESYRMLDFGCGDGGFTAKFLVQSRWLPERLWLAIVEPDATYRQQAIDRLQAFTPHPVQAWPALLPHVKACFELILANHVLYYVRDLKGTLSAILHALATPGLFLAAMAGRTNALAQFSRRCFDILGKPFPFGLLKTPSDPTDKAVDLDGELLAECGTDHPKSQSRPIRQDVVAVRSASQEGMGLLEGLWQHWHIVGLASTSPGP
jgi:SAM-dependent methyltransferase